MPGATPYRFSTGETGLRYSFTAVEQIIGGSPAQLVEYRPLGSNPGQRACGVAGALSVVVAGVAGWDILATPLTIQSPLVGAEHALEVASYVFAPVTFAAAGTPGGPLVAAALGQVAPAGANPDARTLVGFCGGQPVAAGATGFAYIKPSAG